MNKLLAMSAIFILLCAQAQAEDKVFKSAAEDQVGMELTVYNDNLGLVKDIRKVQLPKGHGELRFMDVAATINPVTVHAKSLSQPQEFSILEQNYEYDLINSAKLLDKYVGKKIKILQWHEFQDRKELVDAELLSNNQGPVYKINDEIYLGYPGTQILPKLPENLIAKPTLTWLYDNSSDKPHDLEVTYLADKLNWHADYVLVVNTDDSAGDLSGWVSLENNSGATYKDAHLKLVAGTVNRALDYALNGVMRKAEAFPAAASRAPEFKERGFFEYHIYDLGRRTTVKDKQTKQISLLEAFGAKIKKEFLVYGLQSYFTAQFHENNPKQPVNVYMSFKNSKENNLGMPLPAGIVRLYKQDNDGGREFIGEDRIKHTPKDEEIRLKTGEAFDLTATRLQTDYKALTTRLYESAWEITLRNHKESEVEIGIVEPVPGNWQVIENSHPFKKVDAHTIRFDVQVPKDGEVKVRYRFKVGI